MGKKGAKKQETIGVTMKPEELYDELENGVKSIEQELEIRTRAAEDHTRIFQEYKREVDNVDETGRLNRMITTSVVGDHARRYKATQDVLIQEINSLETNLAELREDREICVNEMEEMIRDKAKEYELKEIKEQEARDKVEQTAAEFISMMEELITKLQ
ncbi:conserved hypothetical protein [Perkinsus marinus ATCC 50983]|nr:conserved hypothetical protein [Perkinsus marinus ATCC 50983]EER03439.1 conserved hypothetical protein [Perkinsus marinus ATCC 50983]|eukprot:XP_002771623.1 conserved hypothetical protein [Perkinsus marinus ATCC 50983]